MNIKYNYFHLVREGVDIKSLLSFVHHAIAE